MNEERRTEIRGKYIEFLNKPDAPIKIPYIECVPELTEYIPVTYNTTAILGIIGGVGSAPVEIQGGISTYSSNNPYVIRSGNDFMFERYERNTYYGGKINSLKINDFYSFTYMNSIYNCVVNSLDSYIYMSPSSFKMEYIMNYTSNSTGANIVETSSIQISVGKGYTSINIKGLLSGVNSGDIYVENGFIKIRP